MALLWQTHVNDHMQQLRHCDRRNTYTTHNKEPEINPTMYATSLRVEGARSGHSSKFLTSRLRLWRHSWSLHKKCAKGFMCRERLFFLVSLAFSFLSLSLFFLVGVFQEKNILSTAQIFSKFPLLCSSIKQRSK